MTNKTLRKSSEPEVVSAGGLRPNPVTDTALKTAAQLWLLTAFVTMIFWLPPL